MTFSAYIQRQKSLIRSRRDNVQTELKEERFFPEYDTETLLEDLKKLKGLNTTERQRYSKVLLLAGKQ